MAREHAQDIVAALNGLGNNLQRLQFQRTISQANEAVHEIRTSEADEQEQMQALRDVAEQVTFNLTAQGAAPQQIAQLSQSIAPFQPAEQAAQIEAARQGVRLQAQDIAQQRQVASLSAAIGGDAAALQSLPKDVRARFVPGAGLALTKEAARDLRKLNTELEPAIQQIERLKAINQIPGRSLSPKLRAEAAQIQRTLIGSLRVALTGPGPLNATEQELLKDAIANPTDFFSVGSLTLQKLDTLQNALDSKLTSAQRAAGIEPINQQQAGAGIPGLRFTGGR